MEKNQWIMLGFVIVIILIILLLCSPTQEVAPFTQTQLTPNVNTSDIILADIPPNSAKVLNEIIFPELTQPVVTEQVVTAVTEPAVTEQVVTTVTEPTVTEPTVTEPTVTAPAFELPPMIVSTTPAVEQPVELTTVMPELATETATEPTATTFALPSIIDTSVQPIVSVEEQSVLQSAIQQDSIPEVTGETAKELVQQQAEAVPQPELVPVVTTSVASNGILSDVVNSDLPNNVDTTKPSEINGFTNTSLKGAFPVRYGKKL